jgi:signal peptide peptidase SppA
MAHSLARIKGSLINTPHLIEQSSFDSIMEYVNQRIEGNVDVTPEARSDDDFGGPAYVADTATGVMQINGPLTYRTSGWEALCGGTSYEMLKEHMEYFVEQGAKTVVMMADSGGGEAHAMMDSANYIRKLADDNGIKIIAYVDGMAASACYGLVCVADEIVMSSDSQVGSIGVLIQLMNNSKQLEKAGIERTFITAGEDKVPFAADGSFTEAFKDRLQTQVDTLYEGFTGHVATHRGLDIKAVKGTQANVFMADEALELGLADSVMTVEEFYDYVADAADTNNKGGNTMKGALKFMNREDKTEMAKLEELKAQLEAEQLARTEASAALATQLAQLNEANGALAALTTQLEGFKEAQALAAKAAADAVVATRKAALSEVVPEAELETYMTNMSSLDEGAFTFMVGTLKAVKDTRAAGFKAVGEDGAEVDDTPVNSADAIRIAGIEAARARRG